jgi:hypothetical protein
MEENQIKITYKNLLLLLFLASRVVQVLPPRSVVANMIFDPLNRRTGSPVQPLQQNILSETEQLNLQQGLYNEVHVYPSASTMLDDDS